MYVLNKTNHESEHHITNDLTFMISRNYLRKMIKLCVNKTIMEVFLRLILYLI